MISLQVCIGIIDAPDYRSSNHSPNVNYVRFQTNGTEWFYPDMTETSTMAIVLRLLKIIALCRDYSFRNTGPAIREATPARK